MKKIKSNKELEASIEWIRNNPFTLEIVSISEVELLGDRQKINVDIYSGDYPTYIQFTAMQQVEIVYKNKYFGLKKDIILAGFDAVKYKECYNGMFEGAYLDKQIIDVEFVGEYATIKHAI